MLKLKLAFKGHSSSTVVQSTIKNIHMCIYTLHRVGANITFIVAVYRPDTHTGGGPIKKATSPWGVTYCPICGLDE